MFIVTEKAQSPTALNSACFYYGQKVGEPHRNDCPLIKKKVKVKLIVEYQIEVPALWGREDIEFHRNASSWCKSNAIKEMDKAFGDKAEKCMCLVAEYKYVGEDTGYFLDEG